MKCSKCGSRVIEDMVVYKEKLFGKEEYIGMFEGYMCTKCGHEEIVASAEENKKASLSKKICEILQKGEISLILVNTVKQQREMRDVVQKDIGRALGVSEQRYGTIERNENTPTVYLAMVIALVLKTDVNNLYRIEAVNETFRKKLECMNSSLEEIPGLEKLMRQYAEVDSKYNQYYIQYSALRRKKKSDENIDKEIEECERYRDEYREKRKKIEIQIERLKEEHGPMLLRLGNYINSEDWDKVKSKYPEHILEI